MKLPRIFRRKNIVDEIIPSEDLLLRAIINGEGITKEKALSLPAVSEAVDLISGTISSIPIKLYQEVDGKITEIKDSRVSLLNDDTKDTLNGVEFKKALVEDYLLGNGGYAYINKKRNQVLSLNYVDESKIQILKNADPIFKSYEILVNGKSYNDFDFIKILRNTKDGAKGKGLLDQVSKAIETAYETMIFQLGLLKTGGNKKGFLKSENPLSKEAMQNLKDAWENLYSTNESNVVVLNKGIDFKESSNSSVEMQLNENKKTLSEEIKGIFHIKKEFNETFKEAIMPILSEIECALNRDLLLTKEKDEYFFAFDLKEILKGTLKERYEAYKIAKETGWITLNEIRYLENYDEIEGLDVIAMSLGSVVYDINTHTYYTPNTDSTKNLEGGEDNEQDKILPVQK